MPTPLSALRWSTCLTSGPTLPAKGGIRKGPLFQTTATMMGLYDPSRHPVIAARPRTPIQPEPVPTEVGPLRNGNPRGDPNAAPRCGAKTRAGHPCKSPAMKNGRCRMHGGASTGPSAPGRARIAAARTIHGGRGAAMRAINRKLAAARRRCNVTIAMAQAGLKVEDLAPLIRHVRAESGRVVPKVGPPLPRKASKVVRAQCFVLRELTAMDFSVAEVGALLLAIEVCAQGSLHRGAMPNVRHPASPCPGDQSREGAGGGPRDKPGDDGMRDRGAAQTAQSFMHRSARNTSRGTANDARPRHARTNAHAT